MDHQRPQHLHPPIDATRNPTRWTWPLATVFAAVAFHPLIAQAACQVDSIEMPVRMEGSRAISDVLINGQTVPLTVDSGAFFSTLTEAAANQLKLTLRQAFNLRVYGVTGRMDTQITTVDKLGLFGGEIPRVQFIVGGSEPGAGTMGLLGRNILALTDTEYDLAHGAIRFMLPTKECGDRNMAYWAGTTPVTQIDLLREDRAKFPAIRANIKLNGVELVALFDSGATTIVSERAARRAGVPESAWKSAGSFTGVGSGRGRLSTAVFDRFEIGDEVIRNNRLMVGDLDLDGIDLLLGIDFFLSHRFYIAKNRETMFITYNGGTVFTLDRDAVKRAARAVDAAADGAPAKTDGEPPAKAEAPVDSAITADQLARRGAASAARNDFEAALADLDRAIAMEPTSAAFFAQRGVVQQQLGHPVKAIEDYDQALKLDPRQSDAQFRRAALRLRAKDRAGALADLEALDQALPPQSQTRLPMSGLYATLEQPARTIAQLDAWLASHPNDAARGGALNSRCWARVMLGSELAKAIDDCDDALGTDADNASYLDSRGWAFYRSGKYEKALADFDRSVALRAGNAWSLYGRGLTKTRLGDAAQGDADLAAARKALADIDARVGKMGVKQGA